ncbi:hypothetical protein PHIN109289_19720 [Phaeobacter inhibens]
MVQDDRVSAAGRVDEGAFDEFWNGGFGDAQFGQSAWDAEAVVQLLHIGADALKAAVDAQIICGGLEAVGDLRCVEGQHRGHADGVGGAVVGVEERPDRVAHGVDRAQPFLEGGGAHGGGRHHLRAGLNVGAISIGARQVLLHQAHALQRDTLGHRVVMGRGERLDTMRKGIQTGACGDELRHADGQFGVADHHGGQHLGVKDDLFLMGHAVGDHRGAAHFGTGPSRGRHRDDRRDGIGIGASPPVADILKIPHRPGLAAHEGNHLAQIQPRAAAKGNHPVVIACLIGGNTGFEVFLVRVGVNLAEHRPTKARGLQDVEGGLGDRQIGQPLVRDQQRFFHARCRAGLGQFPDPASAKLDCGRIGPVSNKSHRCVPVMKPGRGRCPRLPCGKPPGVFRER